MYKYYYRLLAEISGKVEISMENMLKTHASMRKVMPTLAVS